MDTANSTESATVNSTESKAKNRTKSRAQESCSSARLRKLRRSMSDSGATAFLVRDLANIEWLTAFDGVFDTEAAHSMLITQERAYLHTDTRYASACEAAAAGSEITVDARRCTHVAFALGALCSSDSEAGVLCSSDSEKPEALVLAIEDTLPLAEYRMLEEERGRAARKVEILETKGLLLGLRSVKDAQEIARLKAAQAITDAAFAHIAGFLCPGMTEREVKTELEYFIMRQGADALAFPSIVAGGANAANPHAIAGERKLERAQAVLFDFGARLDGYCADMTRMVFLGEPGDCERRAYAALRRANEEVEAFLRPGVSGADAQKLAEEILAEEGFGNLMGHGLGHGLGLEVHELPGLSTHSSAPLVEGNVVTVEPGIYLPGHFGMRLEDFGVVTARGFEVFTRTPHDLLVVG